MRRGGVRERRALAPRRRALPRLAPPPVVKNASVVGRGRVIGPAGDFIYLRRPRAPRPSGRSLPLELTPRGTHVETPGRRLLGVALSNTLITHGQPAQHASDGPGSRRGKAPQPPFSCRSSVVQRRHARPREVVPRAQQQPLREFGDVQPAGDRLRALLEFGADCCSRSGPSRSRSGRSVAARTSPPGGTASACRWCWSRNIAADVRRRAVAVDRR